MRRSVAAREGWGRPDASSYNVTRDVAEPADVGWRPKAPSTAASAKRASWPVRPDRFIAWRQPTGTGDPRVTLTAALSQILARPVGAPVASAV
jgi:hypothetical protein